MNKFRMTRAGVKVNDGLERFSGDMEMYEELLISFLDDTNYQSMKDALAQQDIPTAFRAAHSLKGVAGNLSMEKLYEAVVPAVEKLREGDGDVSEFLPAIEEAYQKVYAAIEDMKGA